MKMKLKSLFILLICIPTILLCSCKKSETVCGEDNVSYRFSSEIACDIFREKAQRTLMLSSITSSKVDLTTLNSYAQFNFTGKLAELYHYYIEYIYFKVYTNQSSEYPLEINLNITNAIKEEDVKNSDATDTTFSNTYSSIPKQNGTIQIKANVDRVIATATGATLTIDALTSDMFVSEDSTFKWTIYDFKIYGEARAY